MSGPPEPADVAMQQAARERPSPDKGGDDKRNKIAGIRINGLNAFVDDCTSTWEKEVPMYNFYSNFDETAGKDVESTGPYIQPQATAPGITMEDVTPERPVYGETSGRLLPPEKVARGRMQELIRLNDHNVASEVPEETAVGYKVVGTRLGRGFQGDRR